MKKLVIAVFAVALLAGAAVSASAYEYTIGGNIGFDHISGGGESFTYFNIAPEFAKIIDEDTNVGFGLSYSTGERVFMLIPDLPIPGFGAMPLPKMTTFGGYLFAERAVLSAGSFKVFLRGDLGYRNSKIDDEDDRLSWFSVGITPNIQYALSDRLTLIASSGVLRLSFDYFKMDDFDATLFGFNAGKGALTSIGLKYAF